MICLPDTTPLKFQHCGDIHIRRHDRSAGVSTPRPASTRRHAGSFHVAQWVSVPLQVHPRGTNTGIFTGSASACSIGGVVQTRVGLRSGQLTGLGGRERHCLGATGRGGRHDVHMAGVVGGRGSVPCAVVGDG